MVKQHDKEDAKDETELEGNDLPSLVGSGAPMVTIRANARVFGLAEGATGSFVQTEDIRLAAKNGLVTIVDE